MGELFGFPENASYKERLESLIVNRIALWDVMVTCYRHGSLDSSIDEDSVTVNDFDLFYSRYPKIRAVFFNGAKAEQAYRKHVLQRLPKKLTKHTLQRLPSTSPANARLALSEKLKKWREVYDLANETSLDI